MTVNSILKSLPSNSLKDLRKDVRTREAKEKKWGSIAVTFSIQSREMDQEDFRQSAVWGKTSTPIHIGNGANIRTEGKVFCSKKCSDVLWEKKCPSDWEMFLKFEAEDREFAKSLEQFIQTEKGQTNFWNRMLL